MTIPFYSQGELDAAIAKERLWIARFLRAHAPGQTIVEALQYNARVDQIAKGDYPRPLVVTPNATEKKEKTDADQ